MRPEGGEAPLITPRRPRRRIVRFHREPVVGDVVLWQETGPVEWTVEALDADSAEATIKTVLFGRPATETVALDELEIRPEEVIDQEGEQLPTPRRQPEQRVVQGVDRSLAPEKPRRDLDVLMDDVLFSLGRVDAYRRRYAKTLTRLGALEKLRDEIRRRGHVIFGRQLPLDEFARIRVEGRFEFSLSRRPSADDPITVQWLTFLQRSRRRRPKH